MKFADIGKKLDSGLEKTKNKTNKVTSNIKEKVYKYEEKTKLGELENQINDLAQDMTSELLLEIKNEKIAEFQSEDGHDRFLDKIKENNVLQNSIYKIRMLQYKKEAIKRKIDRIENKD